MSDPQLLTERLQTVLTALERIPQRSSVKEFRDSGYVGAADTSKSLLTWWFDTPHLLPQAGGADAEFQYYFAQREVVETIVYLHDVVGVLVYGCQPRTDRSCIQFCLCR